MKRTIAIIILVLMVLGLGGYIAYDKLYTKELKPEETKEEKKEETKEYAFDLSKISCTGDEGCSKEVNVSYNEKNHTVKIVLNSETSSETMDYYYDLYIDGKLVGDHLLGGNYRYEPDGEYSDFDGYLYVLNNKYLAFVKRTSMWMKGYSIDLFNEDELVEKDIKVKGVEATNYIDNKVVYSDGESITFYRPKCDNSEGRVLEKIELTFDGIKSTEKVIETVVATDLGGATIKACD